MLRTQAGYQWSAVSRVLQSNPLDVGDMSIEGTQQYLRLPWQSGMPGSSHNGSESVMFCIQCLLSGRVGMWVQWLILSTQLALETPRKLVRYNYRLPWSMFPGRKFPSSPVMASPTQPHHWETERHKQRERPKYHFLTNLSLESTSQEKGEILRLSPFLKMDKDTTET